MKKGLFILTSLLMLGAWGANAQDNVLFPTSGQKTVDLSNKQVGYSMNVYDNGGANGNYTDYCDGQILIKAPQKGSLTLEGSIVTEACCDYLLVYNGSDQSAPVIAEYRGTCNFILQSDNDMLLYFHTDRSVIASGIDSKLFINVNVVESEFTYYDKEKTILKEYTGDKQNVVVPSNVKEIGTNAFNNSCRIVLIPNTVEKIVTKAFNHTAGMKIYCEAESKPDGWAGNWNPNGYPVYWNSAKIPDYDYTINSNNTISITSCNLDKTTVRIPATIRIKGEEYEVTNIATSAFKYCDNLKKVVVGENITGIGENAFQNCANLKTVDLSNAKSFTYISDYAFANSKISRIEIPSWITSIGNYAFQNCDGLTNIAIPASVTWIGNYAFRYCDNLVTVDLSQAKGLRTINNYAFDECYGLKNIEIPNWITSIGSNAFYDCDALTSITIPESVTSIGSSAFEDCNNLETVDLSNARSLTSTGQYVFYNCDKITEITIPSSVTSIGNYAFYDCDGLKEITIPENVTSIGNDAFSSCDNLAKVDLSNARSLTSIGNYAFYYCANLATVDMSKAKSLTSIGSYAFCDCNGLKEITIPENVTTIGNYAFCHCDGLKEITIPKNVTTIGNYAFYDCDGLKEITIPEKVTSIGQYAFYSCDNLAKADLSNAKKLTSIGQYAFSNNKNLKKVDLSNAESLTTINDYAFSSCANLEKVDLSGAKDLSYVNNNAFLRCPKLKSFGSSSGKAIYSADGKTLLCYLAVSPDTAFTVPSTVTTIANNAFINCNKLKQVTIPSSVTSIGSYAFNGCNNLAKIDLSKATGLTSFGSYAFSGCPKLATIDLSATSLTSIVGYAFYDNDYLTEITLPESVTSIGYQAFYDCDNLKQVNLKKAKNLKNIQDYAFYNCDKLEEVDLENATSLQTIGQYAFQYCNALKEAAFPESLTSIGYMAFSYCTNLEKADFSKAKNLTTIGSYAFEYCNKLASADLSKNTGLASLNSGVFCYCNELTDVAVPESITYMASNVFEGSYNVKFNESEGALYLGNSRNPYVVLFAAASSDIAECRINNKTKVIAQNAFNGCSNLKSITIPASVVAINDYAFNGCTSLEKVNLPENVRIGSLAFYDCYCVASVDVPASVSYIGDEAFGNVRNINYTGELGSATQTWGAYARNGKMSWGYTDGDFVFSDEGKTCLVAYFGSDGSVTLPETTKTIISYAFSGCKSLKSVTIPDGVETIYSNAIFGCSNLKTLKIGSGVTYFESGAFNGCPIETLTYNTEAIGTQFQGHETLKTVNVGNKITSIDVDAFRDCPNLTTVNLSNAKKLAKIKDNAFYNSGLTEIVIPESVTSIANAFSYCSNLKKADLSNATGLTAIASETFSYCTSLESIAIPDRVTGINYGAFMACSGLKSVTLGSGIIFIADQVFNGCNSIETLTFNTNYIGGHFKNKTSLKTLNIGDNVTSIPANAFENCSGLTSVKLGKGLKGNFKIGDKAFAGCNNIESVVIESNDLSLWGAELCFIKDGICYNVVYQKAVVVAPYNYSGNVVIPATVVAGDTYKVIGIGDKAFKDCSGLASIDLSKATNLENIGWQAFSNCDGLTKITIPESVTGIDDYAFSGCDNLETVDLSKAKNLVNIYNYAFSNCYNLQTADLSNAKKLDYIGEGAFYYCSSLSRFIIPASVTEVGDYAFSGCTSISPILCEAESQPSGWYYNWNYPNNHRVIWHYNKLKVNLSVNNSEWGTVSGAGTYTYGEDVHIKATPAKGCAFVGWNDDTPFDDFIVPAMNDIDITALFYKVTECVVGNNSVYVSSDVDVPYNCEFTPTISGTYIIRDESSYYTLLKMYDSNWDWLTSSYERLSVKLEAGKKYYIGTQFAGYSNPDYINLVIEEPKYLIAGKAKNGKVYGTGLYQEDEEVNLRAEADANYHFVKWSDGETSSTRSFYAYESATYTAEFEPDTYYINGWTYYGDVEGSGDYAYGSYATLTVKPSQGYEFLQWSDGNTDNPRKVKVEDHATYYAELGIKSYTVNCTAQHATVYGTGEFTYSTYVTLSVNVDANYEIVDWRDKDGNVVAGGDSYSFYLYHNTDIVVNVKGRDCAINASMENGTVEGTGSHEYGTTVTLTAKPQPGYKFTGWNDGETSATRTITVDGDMNLTANAEAIEYSVVVSLSDNTKGTVSSDAGSKIYYGNVVNISATPSGSNKFVRWSDGNTSASRSITVQRDWNLTAVFSEETLYTVTATAGPNGTVTGSARYAEGEKATLTAIANVGYHFVKWSDGSTDASHVITVNGNKSLSAEFAVDTYTVTVAAGANGTVTGGGSFEFGAPATITATASAGYHFAGWSDGNTEANRTFNVSGNLNVTAAFEINTYTVKASAKNGSVEGAGTYNHGAEATLTATASTGYHFAQWSDGNSVNPRKVTVTSDVDLKAEFDVNSYEITVAAANGTVTGAGTYNYGSVATLSATAADGYHFTKWADGVLSSSRSVIVTEDKKFTAEFEVDSYNVSAYAQNGSVEGAGYYNHGASATLTAKADEGYHFIQWSDGVKDKTRTETVLSSMSFEAEFEVNTFNITAAEAANGVVSGAGTYNYGSVATLTAVANEGYHFTQWSDGLTSVTRRLSVVEDAEFSASFEINTYEVKLSAENGTVSGAGTFEHGEEATISAKAAEHYHFVKWSDGNTLNPRTITVTKNRKLTALFEADLYTITVAAENGTVYGASSSFEFGAVATLTASADFGYHFEKWSDGNTDNPRSVTIDAALLSNIDKPFTAIFEKNPSYVGIEDAEVAADEVNIYAHGNTIVVENAENDILVFDAMGRMIAREAVNGDRTEIQVEGTGVYVVKTGSTSKRVMIK